MVKTLKETLGLGLMGLTSGTGCMGLGVRECGTRSLGLQFAVGDGGGEKGWLNEWVEPCGRLKPHLFCIGLLICRARARHSGFVPTGGKLFALAGWNKANKCIIDTRQQDITPVTIPYHTVRFSLHILR